MKNYTILYADGTCTSQPVLDKHPLGIIFNGNLILLREFEIRCNWKDVLEFLPEISVAGKQIKTSVIHDDFFNNLTTEDFEKINQLLVQLKGMPIKQLRFYWTASSLCDRYQKIVSFCKNGVRQKFVERMASERHYVRPIVPETFIKSCEA